MGFAPRAVQVPGTTGLAAGKRGAWIGLALEARREGLTRKSLELVTVICLANVDPPFLAACATLGKNRCAGRRPSARWCDVAGAAEAGRVAGRAVESRPAKAAPRTNRFSTPTPTLFVGEDTAPE